MIASLLAVVVLADPELPPGATGEINRQANGTVCFVVEDTEGARSQLCRGEAGEYRKPLTPKAELTGDPIRAVAPHAEVPPAPTPARVEEKDDEERPRDPDGAGSQWGVVSLGAGMADWGLRYEPVPLGASALTPDFSGFAFVAGIGARYGLKPRIADGLMAMPGISFVVGTAISAGSHGAYASPFTEVRGELMAVTPGGLLQPNFVAYGTSGVSLTPLGSATSPSLRPHFGLGLGWDWAPKGGGGGWGGGWGGLGSGGLFVLPAVLAVIAFVFAGRLEVRYTTPPLSGPGEGFVSLMIGFGS